jgi:hypothetical protein
MRREAFRPIVNESYVGLPIFPDPMLAALVEAIAEAVVAGELPAYQGGVMLDLIDRWDHLREYGGWPGPRGVSAPRQRPPELVADQARIAARWRELAAQVRAGSPPPCTCGLPEDDVRWINHWFRYRLNTGVEPALHEGVRNETRRAVVGRGAQEEGSPGTGHSRGREHSPARRTDRVGEAARALRPGGPRHGIGQSVRDRKGR